MAFCIIVLTLFFGLRWECGTDWEQYYWVFNDVNWHNFYNFNRYGEQNMEIGFAFVNVLLKSIANSYTLYLLLTNLARFLLMTYVSFKLSKYPIISFFGFLSIQYLFPTRNPYATAIYFVSFIYILNRDFRKYALTWIAACSIHISSVIMFPVYFLHGIRLKFTYQVLLYLATIAFANVFSEMLQYVGMLISFGSGTIDEKIALYTSAFREIESTRGIVSMAFPLFFICLFEYIRRHIQVSNREMRNFDFMVVCYICATGLWNLLMNSMPDLCRYVEFINTWPLLIPFVVDKYRRLFFPIVFLLVLYFLYRMNNTINLGLYRDAFVPYHSIFD